MKKSDIKPPPNPAHDRLITDKEVAKINGISKRTVWAWVKRIGPDGRPLIPKPVVQRPGYTRWSENQIQAAIAALKDAEDKEQIS